MGGGEGPSAPLAPELEGGGWGGDALDQARATVLEVMSDGGRGSTARLAAAKLVLTRDFLEHLSDEDLLAEVRRRAGAP